MGAGYHGGFGATKGQHGDFLRDINGILKMNLQLFASKVFEPGGHISKESFTEYREFFLGKSVKKIEKEMNKHGYKTHIESSVHKKSKAKKVVVDNSSKIRNVSTILVSPGSERHGNTAYVKISTKDVGKLKVVSHKSKYITDSKETALIVYARRK